MKPFHCIPITLLTEVGMMSLLCCNRFPNSCAVVHQQKLGPNNYLKNMCVDLKISLKYFSHFSENLDDKIVTLLFVG